MRSGLGEFASKLDSKGSTAKLKILSKKAGLFGESPSKVADPLASPSSKNPKSFRINQTKQSSHLKLNDSKHRIDSRKDSQPSEFFDKNSQVTVLKERKPFIPVEGNQGTTIIC